MNGGEELHFTIVLSNMLNKLHVLSRIKSTCFYRILNKERIFSPVGSSTMLLDLPEWKVHYICVVLKYVGTGRQDGIWGVLEGGKTRENEENIL